MTSTDELLTVGFAAQRAGCLESQLRRLLRRRPELCRTAGRLRLIAEADLPAIRAALGRPATAAT